MICRQKNTDALLYVKIIHRSFAVNPLDYDWPSLKGVSFMFNNSDKQSLTISKTSILEPKISVIPEHQI